MGISFLIYFLLKCRVKFSKETTYVSKETVVLYGGEVKQKFDIKQVYKGQLATVKRL